MKPETISDALNHIDDDLIQEAAEARIAPTPRRWLKWIAAAACLLAVLLAVTSLLPGRTVTEYGNYSLIPAHITELTVTHILGGQSSEFTVSGDELSRIKEWAAQLEYEEISTPTEIVYGGESYYFDSGEGNTLSFTVPTVPKTTGISSSVLPGTMSKPIRAIPCRITDCAAV